MGFIVQEVLKEEHVSVKVQEGQLIKFLVDDKGVIYIPAPEPRGGGDQYLELFVLSTPFINWLQWD